MLSILYDFLKELLFRNKKLQYEANHLYNALSTFMIRQSQRTRMYAFLYKLWLKEYATLSLMNDTLSNKINYNEYSKRALVYNEMIIRIYLENEYRDFEKEFEEETIDIYDYPSWSLYLKKEELELFEEIKKYIKDIENLYVLSFKLFLKIFKNDKKIIKKEKEIRDFLSLLAIINSGREYSFNLFYLRNDVLNILDKIDKKLNKSPSLVEIYKKTMNVV